MGKRYINGRNKNRRGFIEGIIYTGLAGLAVSPFFFGSDNREITILAESSLRQNPVTTQSKPRSKSLLESVLERYPAKIERESVESYISDMCESVPEYVEARNSGQLAGFVYAPSDDELKETFAKFSHYFDEKSKEDYVNFELQRHGMHPEGLSTIIPTFSSFFGMKIPRYIIFRRKVFTSIDNEAFSSSNCDDLVSITFNSRVLDFTPASTDADFISLVKHELKHVYDNNDGIKYGDIHLSYEDLKKKEITPLFLGQLMELRAVSHELIFALNDRAVGGNVRTSDLWYAQQSAKYQEHLSFISSYNSENKLEMDIRERQLEECNGIFSVVKYNPKKIQPQ